MKRRVSALGCALACVAVAFAPLSARADTSEAAALNAGLLDSTNAALQRAMQDEHPTLAQANPVGTPQQPLRKPSLPQGFTYNVDVSAAFPEGDVGYNAGDPGGMDAGIGYAFSRTNRLQLGYYEIQQVPVGFSNVNVPLYLQGYTGPGTTFPGTGLGRTNTGLVDVTTKDKIFTAVDQNLFMVGPLPIVISPTYLAHWASIGGLNQGDVETVEYDGYPVSLHLRTEQEWLLPLTIPFISSPRFFGTVTVASQWLVHTAGVNENNHPQFFGLLYLEYRASRKTTFFFQPSRLVQYDPVDPYPQYTPTFVFGLSYRFTPWLYTQWTWLEGGASNTGAWGITSLTCQRLPCTPNLVAPTIAGLHAAEIQLQLGIGSPTVIPL
jgi:hypothetical protein